MDATTTSPLKRRAALATLDANAMSATVSPMAGKLTTTNTTTTTNNNNTMLMSSPVRFSPAAAARMAAAALGKKRMAEDDGEDALAADGMDEASPAAKKTCVLETFTPRSRSYSPDSSSMFDTSAGDASWATIATEPDAVTMPPTAPVVRTRPRALTREQAREKAEILRLRLGLASYKVRTGQTTVPLADLQPKPLPRRVVQHVRVQSPEPQQQQEVLLPQSHDQDTDQDTEQEQAPGQEDQQTEEDSVSDSDSTIDGAEMQDPATYGEGLLPLLPDGGGATS